MKVRIGDKTYDYEPHLTIAEARVLKKHDIAPAIFTQALMLSDPDAVACLAYLVRTRAGDTVEWDSLDDIVLDDVEILDEDSADEPEDDGVDPTRPADGTSES